MAYLIIIGGLAVLTGVLLLTKLVVTSNGSLVQWAGVLTALTGLVTVIFTAARVS